MVAEKAQAPAVNTLAAIGAAGLFWRRDMMRWMLL